ncbi:hypothetical protein GNI_128290 [Gregarina niphandrodes]|uniref:Eukaryotic translation initiation factor 3 subunit L n=1 Tax=Gregarina niphandrodes TaxID=110365 RepID=A0A023B284_GRENI|nr:hypothetical protein GNI_128290 [Gregarina niphandrodes]EZG48817.1 hypothetical protein GNI_128290 [Gregarina niphandrodes]|eukprot:XP_011132069.1 hypothetical protein GNI_128290 [Gregarina niphandrodes]
MAIGEQAEAFINELAAGLSDPIKLREIYQNRLNVDEWPKIEEVLDHIPDQSKLFYILYQDIRLRAISEDESTWGEKLSIYHNYRLLLEAFSNPDLNDAPNLPVDWLWDSFGFLLSSFVQSTNEKWLLLRTNRSICESLDENEKSAFQTLWDPSTIEELLCSLLPSGSNMKHVAKATLGIYYFAVCDFHAGYEMLCALERDLQLSSAESHYQRSDRQRLNRLMGPSVVYYKALYKMMIGHFTEASKVLGRRNSGANNYGTAIENTGLRLVQGDSRTLGLISICETLSTSTDKSDIPVEEVFRSALIPLCSASKCAGWEFVDSQLCLEERVVPTFMRAYSIAKEKGELVSLANLYHNVTLEKIGKVANKSSTFKNPGGIETIRADLLDNSNLYLTGNSVNIQTVVKQETYTDTFNKQVMRGKELLEVLNGMKA